MTNLSYAGSAEITALANIFNVNIFTWTVTSENMAIVANPLILDPASSTTLHLVHRNDNHFEDTDIPTTFLPQLIEQRTSGRQRRQPRARSQE
jgi:hypothetical protein